MFNRKPKPAINDVKINLLPKDPFYDSVVGKGTTWALSIGRYIVIFTELVVILSFASRFTLDRRVTDLNKEILERQSIIESYGDLEQNVRDVQKKLDVYNQTKMKLNIGDVFDNLLKVTPQEVEFTSITINGDTIHLGGFSTSNLALSNFIQTIQVSPYFINVIVQNITNNDSQSGGFEFQIQAQFVTVAKNGS